MRIEKQGMKEMSKQETIPKLHLTNEQTLSIIKNEQVTVVSFDLFDTLLVRPSFEPKDIFVLLEQEVKEKYGLDFVALRGRAEEELGKANATIHELWAFIGKKHRLSEDVVSVLKQREIDLETSLLTVRRDAKELFDATLKLGKKVIVTSDMYLTSDVLSDILKRKGYVGYSEVYVSCEWGERKDSGKLYDLVLEREGVNPFELVHIGDNFCSDYKIPLEKGILAVFYPSVYSLVLQDHSPWKQLFSKKNISENPYTRILFAFAFLRAYNANPSFVQERRYFRNLNDCGKLFLAPLLVQIASDLIGNSEIQNCYEEMNFVARDGYLPQKIYDILSKGRRAIPSRYVYASRQALCFSSFDGFFDYLKKSTWEGNDFSLADFLKVFLLDEELKASILGQLTDAEKNSNLCADVSSCEKCLKPFEVELEGYFSKQREYSKQYYFDLFGQDERRKLIFDCGYSGSVSVGLNRACGKLFDKYYLWQTEENRYSDQREGTKTVCFFPDECFPGLNIILEELFSPLQGSCVGFRAQEEQIVPHLDSSCFSEEMMQDLTELHEECIRFAKEFQALFAPYLHVFRGCDVSIYRNIAEVAFIRSPYAELKIFDRIRFVDGHLSGYAHSLTNKVILIFQKMSYYETPFSGTGFENPDVYLSFPGIPKLTEAPRIGVHLHLYNLYLYDEIVSYLKNFPYPFDLYLTTPKQCFEPVSRLIFSQAIIPNLQKLEVKLHPNRGRDVAPWLIETRDVQSEYDLFCHIHAKESLQYGGNFGTEWRRYFFDNLIEERAALDIVAHFQEPRMGLIFPACYSGIYDLSMKYNTSLFGECGEEAMIADLLKRMKTEDPFVRKDLLCSFGTMMWYRPKALQPLFDLNLSYEDFPKEPIGLGGTLAHAIERMPAFVAERQGFLVRVFNEISDRNATDGRNSEENNSLALVDMDFNQLAKALGVKRAFKLFGFALRIFFAKVIRTYRPEIDKGELYAVAKKIGLKNATRVLKKAYGVYLQKD